ncbi:MAG: TonB family protein [Candidatus Obscuribacterales bacterium]|nr:TonB family protein [Candidatus Obscuribacterales bacterium]
MKEQSWWSNNLLPVSFVVLVICGLTAGAAGLIHWASSAIKSNPPTYDKTTVEKRIPLKRPPDANSAAWGVYGPYMESIEKEIKTNWHPPKRNMTRRVTVTFNVDRQGHLSNLKVSPSGDAELDQSARQAVEETAPFAHLPAASKDKNVEIQFTFDYNVHDQRHQVNH